MKRYLVATIKSWNIVNFYKLQKEHPEAEFKLVTRKEELTVELLSLFRPDFVFFPHWSWIIPAEIFDSYNCVVFHMTDLPFGRGGSPLQNLIVRGIYDTKISAIKVGAGIDNGAIYFKELINITEGNADEIFSRISDIVFTNMIPRFLKENLVPVEQTGDIIYFKRRKPEQSEIPNGLNQRQVYDYIRMLDGEGYPTAYIKYDGGKIYFTNAKFEDGTVTAAARFVEEQG